MPGLPAPVTSHLGPYARTMSPRLGSASAPVTPRRAFLSFDPEGVPLSPGHTPVALSPTVTVKGSSRNRAASAGSTHRHRNHSPPRSPQETGKLYEDAIQRASSSTSELTDQIIERQSEILSRKHDIAMWERKIAAAKKIINKMEEQVDVLLEEVNNRKTVEKELAAERDAMQAMQGITEKEWNALGLCLKDIDLHGPSHERR